MGVNLTNKAIQDTYEGLVQISGSLLTDGTGSLIPSLDVSASFATTATSASHAIQADTATSASHALQADNATTADSATTATSASHAVNADSAISSSYATTASFAENSTPNTLAEVLTAGNTTLGGQSIVISGSSLIRRTLDGDGITSNIAGGDYTIKAGSVDARLVLTGNGNTATNVIKLDKNGIDITGGVDIVGDLDLGGTGNSISGIAGSAIVIGSNQTISAGGDNGIYSGINNTINSELYNAIVGGNGNTASHARSVVIGGAGLSTTKADEVVVPSLVANSITASFASFQSASIGYLQSITGSAKIIGDAFIILNNNTPTERFAGLVVQDSGSTNNTASFEFDGQTNDWFYEYTDDGGATTEHGVALFGAEYSTKGSPSYPANNVLQKGDGGHHLLDSSITDDGTLVSIDANVSASGYVSASAFIGDGSGLTGVGGDLQTTLDAGNEAQADMVLTGSLKLGDGGTHYNAINIETFDGTNTITGDGNSVGTIAIGQGNTTGKGSSISIGRDNTNATFGNGQNNVIIGKGNDISSGNFTSNNYIFGINLSITGDGSYRTLIGGNNNLSSDGAYNGIFAGDGNTTTHDRSVIIGGSGLTTNHDDEVVVPSLSTYGAIRMDAGTNYVNDIYIIGSGSAVPTGGFGGENIYIGNDNTGAGRRAIVIGQDNTTAFEGNGNDNMLIGWNNQVVSPNFTRFNFALGYNNTITDRTHYGAVVGGTDNTIGASSLPATINHAGVFAGTGNTATHNRSVVVGGDTLSTTKDDEVVVPNLTISGSGAVLTFADGTTQSTAGGGGGATEWQAGTAPSSSVSALNNVAGDIVVGAPHSIVYSSGSAIAGGDGWSSVIGGFNNQITAGASGRNTLIGGQSNTISGNYLNGIFAGDDNTISSGRAVIIGGQGNSIASSGGDFSAIVAGVDNTISGGGFGRSVIVGGENNTINGHLRSVIIGGQNLSTTKANEVVVPSLSTNGAVVQNVEALSVVANVAELDASLGNLFTLTLQNGVNTEVELTNQVAGQTFQLQITNNATSAGTITFDSQFDFEGGTAFTATATTGAIDILTFVCFGGGNVQCVGAKNFS